MPNSKICWHLRSSPNKDKVIFVTILELVALRKQHGEKVIGQVKVDDAVMGMRGLPVMFYDCSALDAMKGITFRGHSIP